MDNPFSINYSDEADEGLIRLARGGDKKALENLVIRHQVFVYNIALKMTRSVADAEDLTQEVFIKAITALAAFEGNSRFRTWLYRIAVNHFINARKRKQEFLINDFESYFDAIDKVPVSEMSEQEEAEYAESIEDIRIRCTSGMLLCLSREQRVVYIIGDMFALDHRTAAEITGLTPGNFRIRLMRARKDLYNWMHRRCGLVNKDNPCRCAKKTKAFIHEGYVDPLNLQFNPGHRNKMFQLSVQKADALSNSINDLYQKVFMSHPLQESVSLTKIVGEIVNDDLMKKLFSL